MLVRTPPGRDTSGGAAGAVGRRQEAPAAPSALGAAGPPFTRTCRPTQATHSPWGDALCADQQDVVVRVCGRHHLRRRRAERAASVDVLEPWGLPGGPVGAGPCTVGGAGA